MAAVATAPGADTGPDSERPVLTVEGLSVELAVPAGTLHAVTDLSLSVRRGETLGIVGESGCGKSMTALAIMNLLPRKARMSVRRMELEGRSLAGLSEDALADLRGDRMAMIFQDPMTSLDPVYKIGDQLEEVWLGHGKGRRREARERAEYLLDRVGIVAPRERLGQYPHELSGGLRQRMMIAMALMCDPALVIADEPTTALDVTMQAQTLDLLKSLQADFGMALILITHDLGVVAHMADRVTVMYAGRAVEEGACEQVFDAPSHPYTRGLIDCLPVLGRSRPKEQLRSIAGIVPALIGDVAGCTFRNRCPHAMPVCREPGVPVREAAPGHLYRCVLTDLPGVAA